MLVCNSLISHKRRFLLGWLADFFAYRYEKEHREANSEFSDFNQSIVTFTPVILEDGL